MWASSSEVLTGPESIFRCFRGQKVSDARDSVFTLLTMIAGSQSLKIDYEMSVEDVFLSTAKYLLKKSMDILLSITE